MEKKPVEKYYLDQGYNCAESVLRAANDQYQLGLSEEALHTAGGFGGGMGCGSSCGALCGAIQTLGAAMLSGRAADCPGFRDKCASYFREFEEELGSSLCAELKCKSSQTRCFAVVDKAYGILEGIMDAEKK